MKKIFVVTSGEYSDYSISGIFSTKQLAQKYIDSFGNRDVYSSFNKIEVHNLDPFEIELRDGYKPYFLRMDKDGNVSDIKVVTSSHGFDDRTGGDGFDINGRMYVYVYAENEIHAIKICNEKHLDYQYGVENFCKILEI